MRSPSTNEEAAETIGLRAIAWIIADDDRAGRLLALTGLDSDDLRAGLGDRTVLAAVLAFLESHEPDLLACADALEVDPVALVRARATLEGIA